MLIGAGLFTRQADFAAGCGSRRSIQPFRMNAAYLQNGHDDHGNENGRQTVFHHIREGARRIAGRNARPHVFSSMDSPAWRQRCHTPHYAFWRKLGKLY
jgi:hypothetical protein